MNQVTNADILLMTTAKSETQALLSTCEKFTGRKPTTKTVGQRTYYDCGEINGSCVFLALCQQGTGGIGGSQEEARIALDTLQPGAVVMLGFAFGIDENTQKIGEILVSRKLRLYDLQRVGTNAQGQMEIRWRGDRPSASTRLLNWLEIADLQRADTDATVKFGLILTGDKLVDNLSFREELLNQEPEAIGGEMEGAGLYVACHNRRVDWVIVKAICDWADKKSENKEERQKQAANNSAEFVMFALQHVKLTQPERTIRGEGTANPL